jgi:hypothetical protein
MLVLPENSAVIGQIPESANQINAAAPGSCANFMWAPTTRPRMQKPVYGIKCRQFSR